MDAETYYGFDFSIVWTMDGNDDYPYAELIDPEMIWTDVSYGDSNGDGKKDSKDIVLLKRYLANYDYDTGTSTVPLGPQIGFITAEKGSVITVSFCLVMPKG